MLMVICFKTKNNTYTKYFVSINYSERKIKIDFTNLLPTFKLSSKFLIIFIFFIGSNIKRISYYLLF